MALRTALHCAGLWLVVALAAGTLTKQEEQSIVELHNRYRANVEPHAADMTTMSWNEDLRLVAEHYAAKCIWDHNPEVMETFGENLFITTGTLNISKAMGTWYKEKEHYVYDDNTCADNEMCGHYTQVVWAKSTDVGCASHLCETVEGLSFKNAILLVCNYNPPGNVEDQRPYEEGEPCTKCPEGTAACEDNLCSTQPAEILPSDIPTVEPDKEILPSDIPTVEPDTGILPSDIPTVEPDTKSWPSDIPTEQPKAEILPSDIPTVEPDTRILPSDIPTVEPNTGILPSDIPTVEPNTGILPSDIPTVEPDTGILPSDIPTVEPKAEILPSDIPTVELKAEILPSDIPTVEPDTRILPSDLPTVEPDTGILPSDIPTVEPKAESWHSGIPGVILLSDIANIKLNTEIRPSDIPSMILPSDIPTIEPNTVILPSDKPSIKPEILSLDIPKTEYVEGGGTTAGLSVLTLLLAGLLASLLL